MTLTDEELYEGFSKEQAERYSLEARQRYGTAQVEESERRLRKMSKAQWTALKQEGQDIYCGMAALMDKAPDDPQVQAMVARHHAMIEKFYPVTEEIYRGLGQLYVEHDEFRAFYEKIKPGLADFLKAAMDHYSDHTW